MVISGCWQALRRVCSCGCSSDAPENTAPRQRSRSPISGAGGAAVAGERRRDAEIPEAEPSPAATNTTTTATNNKDNSKDEFLVSVLQTDANRAAYPSNAIHTARYTIWTCVPLGLIFQFRKVSNCYFLLVMMISLVPGASPINPMSSILPLSIVLGVGMAKDLWEDWKRRKADEYANNIEVHVLRDVEEMSFTAIQSSDLVPGDVVLFRLGEEVRADCIILNTSLPQGLTYVETSNLDGETNAKTKRAQHQLLERVSTVEDVVELVHGRGSTMASSFVSAARPLSATIPLQNRGGPTPPPLPSAPTSMWERPASGSLPPRCDDCCLTSSSPHPRRTSALFSGDATIAMEVEELSDHNPFEAPNVLQVGPVFSTPDGADDLCPAPTTAPSSPASPSVVVVGAAGPAVGTALIGTSDDRSGEGFSIRGSTPVADLSSWYGQAIVANREKISLGIDQFIPRGCVIRNTEWVLAVVLYTGTNTKMLLNLRPRPVKGTTMSRRLNWLNLCFFMVNQCIMVTLCSLAVWFKHHKLTQQPGTKTAYSAWYIQWQLEQYSDVHLFGWRYLTNFVLVSYLIPMSLYVTLEGVKAYQMHLIAVDHCMSVEDPFSTEPGARRFAQPKTSELNSQLSQVRFVFTDKTGTLTENLMTYVGGYVSGSYHDEREAPGGLGRSLLRKFMRYQQRMMAASPHPHMFSRSASFSSIRRVSDQLHRRIMTTDRSGGMSTGESADHPVPWLRIPSRQEEISFLALEPSIHMANRAAAASAAFGPMRSFDANASAQHLPAEDDLEENDAYCYLRAMALCHTVVCFTQETDDEKVVADAIGEPKKKHGAHATEGGKEASPLRAKKKVRIAPGAGSPSQQRRRQRRVLEEGSPRSQAGAPMLQLPQILHASTDDGTSHGGGGGAATSAHFAHQRTSTGLGVSRPTLYGEGAEEEVATTNPDGSRRRRLVHRRFHPIGAGTSVTSTNVLPMPTPSGMHAYYSSMQMDELTSLPHGSASPPNLPSRHGRTLSGSGVLRGDVSAFHTPHAPALSGALMGGGGGVGAAMGSVGALHTLSRTVSASQLPLYHRHTESAQSMHTLALGADVLTMDGLVDRSKLYEGQSLDEIALVSAARENGFCLYERSAKYMYIKVFGQVMCYEIVAELEFTAQRKLMSIILRRYPAGDTEEHANSAATKSGSGAPSHYRRSPSSAQAADTTSSPLPKDDGQQQEDSRRPYPTTENLSAVPSQTSTMSPYGSPFGIDGSPDFTGGRQRTDVFVEATGTAAPRPGTAPGRGATTTTTASAAADVVVVQDSPSMTMMSEKKRIPPRPPLPSPPQPPPLSGLIPPPPPPPPQQPPHYLMLTKGADSSMMGIVNMAHHKNAALKPVLSKQLDATAKLGLRTLVLGQRRLTESEVQAWLPIYEQALCTMENRNEQLHAAYAMIERDVDLVGATAVEDKLQDGVPETLEFLSQAQIVVWMLTGDKRETAVTIAQTSGLVSPAHHDGIVHLDISDMLDEAEKMQQTSSRENSTSGTNTTTTSTSSSSSSGSRESSEANLYSGDLCGECSGSSGERRSGSPTSAELQAQRANMAAKLDAQIDVAVRACEESMAQYGSSKTVIVVDGKTLDFIFGDDDRTKRFFDLGCLCRSAVCCRMTPLQKAQVVRLFQHRTGAIALGIGDGANDVYMIQESKIGVGIMGLEGSQAELASDYALPKFRFLKRLLMVHGRASYYREAHCILYSLYKNVILTVGMVGYCFFCGYSGQAFVDSWFISLFSVIYCCLQPIVLGVFDKDVDDELAESVPLLYPVLSREDTYFSPAYMFKWLLDGFVEGVLFFCYVIFVVGRHNDLYAELQGSVEDYGQLFFTMLVVVADLRAFATASYFTIIVVGILGLELIGVPCFGIMVCSLHIIFGSNWNVYVAQELYGTSRSFWLGILFAVGLMSIITLGIPLFVQLFRPWKSAGIAYNTARSSSFRALHHEEVHALMKELKEREDLQKEKERQCDLLNLHFS